MSFYLLEIGCEELPAAQLPIAVNFVSTEAKKTLDSLHLSYSQIKSGGTPRRVYLYIDGLADKQDDREDEIAGPPAKIAFNADGSISDVGMKFVNSKGLDIATVKKASSDKGEYLTGIKKTSGELTTKILESMVANIVKTIPFSKSMRWGATETKFCRPLKYVMSIYNGEILNVNMDNIPVVKTTVGHRFLSPSKQNISDFDGYKNSLMRSSVIIDIDDRKKEIVQQINSIASKHGFEPDIDDQLLDHVSNLVELPHAILGNFDKSFLALPSKVLVTSMKYHQKFFPVYDKSGNLLNHFIGISNMKPKDDTLIQQGYERVLHARLNDALFFYNNDKNTPLEERVEMLKKVVYQEKLGTSYEKMQRFSVLAGKIADIVAPKEKASVLECAKFCKADLMTEMVYEFPELQGFMGNVYAKVQSKEANVAKGIEEHYMPRFAGDKLPETTEGKIVSIADKLDTIAGAFAIGMIPTGNADPYGLRRQSIGILNIVEQSNYRLDFKQLILLALEQLTLKAKFDKNETADKIMSFISQRQKQLMVDRNEASADAYDAASANAVDFIFIKNRAIALNQAKNSIEFQTVAASYKRINNILKKAGQLNKYINETVFEQNEEKILYSVYKDKMKPIEAFVKKEDWSNAIKELTSFAAPLDSYFKEVMVMAKTEEVKANRLATLASLKDLFITIGDLDSLLF